MKDIVRGPGYRTHPDGYDEMGNQDTNNSWRHTIEGEDLYLERKISGVWTKVGIVPAGIPFTTYIDVPARFSVNNIHGGLDKTQSNVALNSGSPITMDHGIEKIVISIISGADFNGTIRLTGDTVDRNTGVVTPGDIEDIPIDALTTDSSTTDGGGNPVYSLVDAYITSKWFSGSITITTADVDVEVDIYHCTFEQANDIPLFEITTYDVTLRSLHATPELYSHLYSVVVVGFKVTISEITNINLPTAIAGHYYRLRRGLLATVLNGTTDGFFLAIFQGGAAPRVEDITLKIWIR